MEALNFLKFWKPTTTSPSEIQSRVMEVEEEEDDSFFDLELSVTDSYKLKQSNPAEDAHLRPHQSPAPNDIFSKRKISSMEQSSSSKPRSPIGLLRSAPRFRVFNKSHKTEDTGKSPGGSRGCPEEGSVASDTKSFSKEAIQRYLKLMKLLQTKSSKKNGERRVFSLDSSMGSAQVCSPRNEKQGSAHSGIRVVYKNLGKVKSSIGVGSPARRDDSLLQQHDGIQSAILHCKRSFDSSRESSTLSRSSSDSPRDPIKISNSDSSMLSRYSSDKWMDPARISMEGESSISGM